MSWEVLCGKTPEMGRTEQWMPIENVVVVMVPSTSSVFGVVGDQTSWKWPVLSGLTTPPPKVRDPAGETDLATFFSDVLQSRLLGAADLDTIFAPLR